MNIIVIVFFVFYELHFGFCFDINQFTAYNYHKNIGIDEAFKIKLQEESNKRIVGGTQVSDNGGFPYQAGLLITLTSGWTSVCGASLISRTSLLTAAHCWYDGVSQARNITVVLGSLKLYTGGTRVETSSVVVHGNWNPNYLIYDIAILKIPHVEYNNNIFPIPLPDFEDAQETFAGLIGRVSGYGKTSDAVHLQPQSSNLHHIDVPVLTNQKCQSYFDLPIHLSHICTSGEGNKGTCDGDSGSPLTVVWKNHRVLVGIASFNWKTRCQTSNPSVFARVTPFLPWIQANI